jgi:hypothetical protein
MVDRETLEAIGQMMDEKLKPIHEELAALREDQAETRDGVNALLEWAEECGNVISFLSRK